MHQPARALSQICEDEHNEPGNNLLGRAPLDDIPPAPRGVPLIGATHSIDANGILNMGTADSSQAVQSVTIANEKDRLSQAELDRMV